MPTDVERLAVLIEANTKSYERAMAKLEQRTRQTLSRMERQYAESGARVEAIMGKARTRLGSFLTVAAATQAASALKRIVAEMGDVADAAARAGASTDFLQSLGFKVEQAGGSFEDAVKSVGRFGKELGDANVATSYLGRLLAANGVDIKKFKDDAAGAFEAYARVVANARNQQEAMNMIAAVFGERVGPKMLTTVQDIGRIGMPAFIQSMKDAGVVIDEKLIKSADKIDEKWNTLLRNLGNKLKSFIVQALDAEALADLPKLRKELSDLESSKNSVRGAVTSAINPKMYDGRIVALREQIARLEAAAKEEEDKKAAPPPANPSRNVPVSPESKKSSDFERNLKRLREQIALGEKEAEVIGLSTYERERALTATKLEQAAKEANTAAGMSNNEVTAAQRVQIDSVADAYGRMAVKLEAAKGPLQEFAREGANVKLRMEEAVVSGLKSFEDALIGVIQGSKDAKEAFRDMANGIIADLLRIAIRQNITGPIASMMGMGGGASGGGILSMLGGLFGGARATGGQVMPGRAYLVNEQTPRSELFVPQVAGRIEQNKGGGGGGRSTPTVIIQQSFHNTFSGMTGSDRQWSETRMAQIASQAKQAAVSEVRAAPQRRG